MNKLSHLLSNIHMRKLIAKVILGVVISFPACSPQIPTPNTNRDQSNSPVGKKFGLSEAVRKQISEEIFQLCLQASNEASKKYPLLLPGEEWSTEKMKQQARKKKELEQSLINKYTYELTKKYRLSSEQLAEINEEGMDKEWIKYPPLPTVYK
jgi:hypothetical protein